MKRTMLCETGSRCPYWSLAVDWWTWPAEYADNDCPPLGPVVCALDPSYKEYQSAAVQKLEENSYRAAFKLHLDIHGMQLMVKWLMKVRGGPNSSCVNVLL